MITIEDYGAIGDGKHDNAEAIQRAIDEASFKREPLLIPKGDFLSGSLLLRSHLVLILEKGATLISSLDPKRLKDFSKGFDDDNKDTGWDGGCFLFGSDLEDVTLQGEGRIDGRGRECFFDDHSDDGFDESPLNNVPHRPRMCVLEHVKGLRIEGITFYDASFWTLHLAGCEDVILKDLTIENNIRGANNDGIDPDCCKRVRIEHCNIKCGDDCIVLKTTKPMYEKYGDCEDIQVKDCVLESRSSAIKIGTETYGDIHQVSFQDCTIKAGSKGIGIWSRDGGNLYDMKFEKIHGKTRGYHGSHRSGLVSGWWGKGEPVFISATPRAGVARKPGKIHDLSFDRLNFTSEACLFIAGERENPIENISIRNSVFVMDKMSKERLDGLDEQPSERGVYAHEVPKVYLRSTKSITLDASFELKDSMKAEMVDEIIEE